VHTRRTGSTWRHGAELSRRLRSGPAPAPRAGPLLSGTPSPDVSRPPRYPRVRNRVSVRTATAKPHQTLGNLPRWEASVVTHRTGFRLGSLARQRDGSTPRRRQAGPRRGPRRDLGNPDGRCRAFRQEIRPTRGPPNGQLLSPLIGIRPPEAGRSGSDVPVPFPGCLAFIGKARRCHRSSAGCPGSFSGPSRRVGDSLIVFTVVSLVPLGAPRPRVSPAEGGAAPRGLASPRLGCHVCIG